MPSPITLLRFRHHPVNDLVDTDHPDVTDSSLRTLPSEVLQMIALQLPLSNVVSFALINRRLSTLVGPTYWPRLRTRAVITAHREPFLSTFTVTSVVMLLPNYVVESTNPLPRKGQYTESLSRHQRKGRCDSLGPQADEVAGYHEEDNDLGLSE